MTLFPTQFRHVAMAATAAAFLSLAAPNTGHAQDFSDGQLQSFATAWLNINELAEEWKPQVEAATSEDQAAEVLQQFEAAANQVIEQTDGIGTAEYESIIQAAQSDPALKERIFALVQESQPAQ